MSEHPSTESLDLFRLAVELSPSGLAVVDASGTILLVNREVERMFGYPREELIGKPIETLVPARFRAAHPGYRTHYCGDPQSRPMGAGRDLKGLRKDGTEVPVEIGLNPIRTDQGLFVFSSIVDISERRKIENQLRQSQKMEAIGTLAGGVAHDFNNLLLSIVGHTELALNEIGERTQVRSDLDQVLKAAERGRLLVQRILTFSRQREVTRVPLPLSRPLREALQLLRASLPSTIEIRESIHPGTPEVLSDETEIHQIVMNLATNASHAMDGSGVIEMRLSPSRVTDSFAARHPDLRPGLHALVTVTDTGHGMAPEVLERVLEPFFTTKPPGTGTGLGLAVIHGIVKSHGGAIELTSEPDKGTRVDIYLPAIEIARSESVTDVGVAGTGEQFHILLVEDEESLASMERRQLEALGYRVTVHTSSVEALDDFRARANEFDLLMTDNTMPRMPGLVLAQEIHGLRPELPILMVSGLADGSDPEQLRSKGISKLLRKPHTGRELGEAIRGLLARRAV